MRIPSNILFLLGLAGCHPYKSEHIELPGINTQSQSPVYSTAPSSRFAIIGDFGQNGTAEYQVSQMVKSWQPDFIITTGDNNYPSGLLTTIPLNITQFYNDFIYNPDAPTGYECSGVAATEQRNRFFPVLGNHDFANTQLDTPYLSYFSLPGNEVYYDFIWGSVHFFALNTGAYGTLDSAQLVWFQQQVAASDSPYKIAYFHHPPYSTSLHGSDTCTQLNYQSMGISAVISGHSHTYERVLRRSQPKVTYFVNGLGGRNLYDCNAIPLPNNADLLDYLCFDRQFGAMLVHCNADELVFEFYTIDDWTTPLDKYVVTHSTTPMAPHADSD